MSRVDKLWVTFVWMRFLWIWLLFAGVTVNAQQLGAGTAPSEALSLHWQWVKGAQLHPGVSGNYVSWDFSSWTDSLPGGQFWDDPAAFPFDSATFRGNLAYEDPLEGVHFIRVNNSGTWLVRTANAQSQQYFADSLRWMRYPMVYGDSLFDNFRGAIFTAVPSTITGKLRMDADGFGQLLIPGRTVDSVMRLHYQLERWDTFLADLGFPVTVYRQTHIYRWQKDGSPEILAEIVMENENSSATGSTVTVRGFYGKAIYYSGQSELAPVEDWLIYPQPAQGIFFIKGLQYPAQISIINLQGQEVFSGTVFPEQAIAPQGLTAGYYQLRIREPQITKVLKLLWRP